MTKIYHASAIFLMLVASGAVQAQSGGGRHTHVDALASAGIVFGQTLRVTFVNTGEDAVTLAPCIHDADGVIVKQSSVTLRPGQTGWLDVSRGEVIRGDGRRAQLRTGVVLARATDARSLLVAGEIVDEESGKTTDWIATVMGWGSNHNETLVVDDDRAQ
jgi:hypothetical protein